jgi:hypothetical protein
MGVCKPPEQPGASFLDFLLSQFHRLEGASEKANGKNRVVMVIGATLLIFALIVLARSGSAQAQRGAGEGSGPRYTVIETQGFNLLVTDNAASKLYYCATDKDAPVGSPMKLRASLDLSQVSREEIKITHH